MEVLEDATVDRCIKALKEAKSDTEIFSALLVVVKIVKADSVDQSTCKNIYEAIGFNFIEKMLNSNEDADGCPHDMYKSVAYTILSSFCLIEEFAIDPKMATFTEHFKHVLLCNPDDANKQFMVSDVLSCLQSIAVFERGRSMLLEHDIVLCLAEMIKREYYYHEEALSLLISIMKFNGSEIWRSCSDEMNNIVQKLSAEFRDDQNERKFEVCTMLFELLIDYSSMNSERMSRCKKDWTNWIHKGLSDILRSKISKEQRDPAILLLSIMLECFGLEWLIQSGEENDKKFFLAVVHLMCIEIRMNLEIKSLMEIIKESVIMTSCYTILEKLIMGVTSGDCMLGLERKQSIQFISALTGAFKAVLKFLKHVSEADLTEIEEVYESQFKSLIMASFRVLCSWLAEDTAAVQEELNEVLPFLLNLAKDNLNNKDCLDDKHHIDIMRFFLAPLCHLSADDTSRAIIIKHKFHHIIGSYLDNIWKKFKSSNFNCDELEAALSTICGIFMNIVVLEHSIIVTDQIFNDIFIFTYTSLPLLNNKKDHLILRANFAVLGLLTMKYYISKVNTNEMVMYKYLSCTLKFLWDAHNVDDSRDSTTLVINIDYRRAWDDINELWFLGMQALSAVLNDIPWICDFILESGWTQELIGTFARVKADGIEPSIKCTFENFLCSLTQTKSHGAKFSNAMKDKGCIQVCKTHELKELLNLLENAGGV